MTLKFYLNQNAEQIIFNVAKCIKAFYRGTKFRTLGIISRFSPIKLHNIKSLGCTVTRFACRAMSSESEKTCTKKISALSCIAPNAAPVTRASRLKSCKTSRTTRWNDKRGINNCVEFCNRSISLKTPFCLGFVRLRLFYQKKKKKKRL